MVTHDLTANNWMGYVIETNYGGGDGGAAHAHTAATQGNLTAMDRVRSINIEPAAPFKSEERDIDAGMSISDVLTLYTGPGTITLECYLQTDDWYDIGISGWGNQGTEPTSTVIHFDNGVTEKDLFGCVVTEMKFSAKTANVTIQTITMTYSFVADGSTLTKVAWNSSAVSVPSDVSATIDGITSANLALNSIELTITNKLLESEDAYILGVAYLYTPAIVDMDVELVINYKDRSTSTWGAFDGAKASQDEMIDATFFNASLVMHTTLTIALTNIYLSKANSGVREENGLISHEATFRKGESFAIA